MILSHYTLVFKMYFSEFSPKKSKINLIFNKVKEKSQYLIEVINL